MPNNMILNLIKKKKMRQEQKSYLQAHCVPKSRNVHMGLSHIGKALRSLVGLHAIARRGVRLTLSKSDHVPFSILKN